MRKLLVGLLAVWGAQAQFTEIAATDNGSQVYVTTTFVTDGIDASSGQRRIFQVSAGAASLFAQPDAAQSSNVGAVGPQVSGDGSVVGYTIRGVTSESYLRYPQPNDLGEGNLQLSRNGKWALLTANGFTGEPIGATLINLETGDLAYVPNVYPASRILSSDGSVLTSVGIWKSDKIAPITLPAPLLGIGTPPALSDDASTIVFVNDKYNLIARNVASGADTVISDSFAGIPSGVLSLSADGHFVLFGTFGDVPKTFVADAVAGQKHEVPLADGESTTAGVINASGTTAFIGTSLGRILQLTLSAGKTVSIAEVIPSVPYLTSTLHGYFAPGSLVRLNGSVTGTVDSLNGRLLLDGVAMPILSVDGTTITAQAPWEARTGARSFEIDVPNATPFRQGGVRILGGYVQFERDYPSTSLWGLKWFNEDFSALVTNPLQPGAVIHMYVIGLGPVAGSIITGAPAPPDPLMPIKSTLTCQFTPQTSSAETLFAGLAPGLTGVYQVDLRLPDEGSPVNVTGVKCTLVGDGINTFSTVQ